MVNQGRTEEANSALRLQHQVSKETSVIGIGYSCIILAKGRVVFRIRLAFHFVETKAVRQTLTSRAADRIQVSRVEGLQHVVSVETVLTTTDDVHHAFIIIKAGVLRSNQQTAVRQSCLTSSKSSPLDKDPAVQVAEGRSQQELVTVDHANVVLHRSLGSRSIHHSTASRLSQRGSEVDDRTAIQAVVQAVEDCRSGRRSRVEFGDVSSGKSPSELSQVEILRAVLEGPRQVEGVQILVAVRGVQDQVRSLTVDLDIQIPGRNGVAEDASSFGLQRSGSYGRGQRGSTSEGEVDWQISVSVAATGVGDQHVGHTESKLSRSRSRNDCVTGVHRGRSESNSRSNVVVATTVVDHQSSKSKALGRRSGGRSSWVTARESDSCGVGRGVARTGGGQLKTQHGETEAGVNKTVRTVGVRRIVDDRKSGCVVVTGTTGGQRNGRQGETLISNRICTRTSRITHCRSESHDVGIGVRVTRTTSKQGDASNCFTEHT